MPTPPQYTTVWFSLALVAILGAVAFQLSQSPAPSSPPLSTTTPPAPSRPASPPPSLDAFTASNLGMLTIPTPSGPAQPLTVEQLDVAVHVQGRLARTQVTQVFRNHTAHQTEGTYTFTLPEGASISRLAMDVEGVMTEGELVERERARRIYESIVNKRKDPALLEWQGGNRFKTRIFPIPAHGTKTVVLAYDQLLPRRGDTTRYTYSLPRLEGAGATSPIPRFGFTLTSDRAGTLTRADARYDISIHEDIAGYSALDFHPNGPLTLHFVHGQPDSQLLTTRDRGERFFLIDHVPRVAPVSGAPRDLVIALDTSAGIGEVEAARAREVALALMAKRHQSAQVRVVMGDLTIARCPGPLRATDTLQAKACMEARPIAGATDLWRLLEAATESALETGRPTSVVLLTDGVATTGELDGEALRERLAARVEGREVTLHTVAIGHDPDEDLLTLLAQRGGGHSVRMTPATPVAATVETLSPLFDAPLVREITATVVEGEVEGLTPERPLNQHRTQPQAFMGRLKSPRAVIEIRGTYAGRPVSERFVIEAPDQQGGLLRGFWARAWIADMERRAVERRDVVATSLRYGVMSRATSFLVLENQQSYDRFQITRRKQAERDQQQGRRATLQRSRDLARLVENKTILKTVETRGPGGSLVDALSGGENGPAPFRGKKAGGEEGRFGDPETDGEMVDKIDVTKIGLQRSLGANTPGSGALKNLFGDSFDARMNVAMSGEGNELMVGRGGSGLRRSGTGLGGGGGEGIGRIHGQGKVDTGGGPAAPKARVTLSATEVSHPERLNEAATRTVIFRRRSAIRSCFEREASLTRGLLTVQFTVNALGRVESIQETHSPPEMARAGECATRRMKGWRFPKPDGGSAEVTQRFAFERDVAVVAKTREQQIAAVKAERRGDMGDPSLIEALYHLNRATDPALAERILSEVVEFAPHEPTLRARYAHLLEYTVKRPVAACEQLALKAQLAPRERNVFLQMMDLRRDGPNINKEPIQRCVVDGVRKLPVHRDVSLILTWEDPEADIDLHVHEPGGEEVWYHHKRSASGGLLYHDVLNGFGPEIYVLADGPFGEYKVDVIYYGGRGNPVRGTLTVLRDAGTPQETMEVKRFVLRRPQDKRRVHTFTVTPRPANP